MKVDFDIVIATYNRGEKLKSLVDQILGFSVTPKMIIIVDSSDSPVDFSSYQDKVNQVITGRKNQPWQRYLGYLNSGARYILYLDDDVEINDSNYLLKLNQAYGTEDFAGVTCYMENKHKQTALNKIPITRFKSIFSTSSFIRFLTANPILPAGKFWWCGVRGPLPDTVGYVEYFRGWAFSAKRELLYKNFNYQLFELFDNHAGMGEDAILGYTLSKHGKIGYITDFLFIHNDQQNSVYTNNHYAYARRVSYSRFYLAAEYGRLNNQLPLKARLIYYWYSVCRLIGLSANLIISPSADRWAIWRGAVAGIIATFKFRHIEILK